MILTQFNQLWCDGGETMMKVEAFHWLMGAGDVLRPMSQGPVATGERSTQPWYTAVFALLSMFYDERSAIVCRIIVW